MTSFAYYTMDSTNNITQGADVAVTAGAFSFSVPSGAIVTLTASTNDSVLSPPRNCGTIRREARPESDGANHLAEMYL